MNNFSISFFDDNYKLISLDLQLVDVETPINNNQNNQKLLFFKDEIVLSDFLKKHIFILEKYENIGNTKKQILDTQEIIKHQKIKFFLQQIKHNIFLNFNCYNSTKDPLINDNNISGMLKIQYDKLKLLSNSSIFNFFITFYNINFNLWIILFVYFFQLILNLILMAHIILIFFLFFLFFTDQKDLASNKDFDNVNFIGFFFNVEFFNNFFYFFNGLSISIDWHKIDNNKFISYLLNVEYNNVANIKKIKGNTKNSIFNISLSFLSLSNINHILKLNSTLNLNNMNIPFFTIIGIQRNFILKKLLPKSQFVLFIYYIDDLKSYFDLQAINRVFTDKLIKNPIDFLFNKLLIGFNIYYKKFSITFVWYQTFNIEFSFNNGINKFSAFQLKHIIINNYIYQYEQKKQIIINYKQ